MLIPYHSIILVLQGTSEVEDGAPPNFWENMSNELFEDVLGLHEQIDAYLPLRSGDEGFPAIIVRKLLSIMVIRL
jgi:hypothetical protein